MSIDLDGAGNIYIGGGTRCVDLPISNAAFPSYSTYYLSSLKDPGTDGYIAKFNPECNALLYSTYIGSSDLDKVADIAVNDNGNVYVTGTTTVRDFPQINAPIDACSQCAFRAFEIIPKTFVIGINTSLSGIESVIFSTYLGGSESEVAKGIALDSCGNIFVYGGTESKDFPKKDNLQSAGSSPFVFITEFSPDGQEIIFSTLLANAFIDDVFAFGKSIAISPINEIYITGYGNKDFITTPNVVKPKSNLSNPFVAKISNSSPGKIEFGDPFYNINEDDAEFALTLIRTGGSSGEVKVSFKVDGTELIPAISIGSSVPLEVVFKDGETAQNLRFLFEVGVDNKVINKTIIRKVTISNPTGGATLGSQTTTEVRVFDDDE